MIPTDTLFESVQATADAYDSGFSGVPFGSEGIPILQWLPVLFIVAWIGLLLLTWECIKVNPASKLPEVDTDTLIMLVAWVGLILLTAYTLRIMHGP